MAKNLLVLVPKLDEWDRKEITNAMRNHDPEKPVIDYDSQEIWFLDCDRVIAALLEVHRIFGTAAALATARKLGARSGDQ